MRGVVVKSTGSWYDVKTENGEVVKCRIRGVFRIDDTKEKYSNPVAVGDLVEILNEGGPDGWVISAIEPRHNYIVRSSPRHRGARQILAANIDQCVLIVTLIQPRTSTGFIDRFLLTAEAYHIPTIIVFNKTDLLDEKNMYKLESIAQIYRQIGYRVLFVSALKKLGMSEFVEALRNKITLLAGHSGVGKSTLMNTIQPHLHLRTQEVSRITGKGMHTTTFAEMHFLDFGGSVIDAPGIREFGITDFKPEEISHYYIEMREVLQGCKFNNCLHENEPECAVKKAYLAGKISEERYTNYLNILQDYRANYRHWE
ncbi:MAG: ribosome small subunit-dependent GTPase A [Chitinophagales bacterium]|nr:ribosome small subunit-dependent GTPase A [Chitinophagales bacterium]MDW8418630.1 ribosome small subunit-dependent GTPase A [Chitinophagales bacterium]